MHGAVAQYLVTPLSKYSTEIVQVQEGALLDVRTNNIEVAAWLADVANTRIHRTTGQAPSVLLEAERAHL